jgi:hypothetical protein
LVTHGNDGLLYFNNLNSSVITKIDPSGSISNYAAIPELVTGLACDIDGTLFATGGKKVYRIALDATVSTVADFSNAGWPTNRLYTIGGITRASNGTFYAVRQGDSGLVYSLDLVGGWQMVGGYSSGLYYARQVAVDQAGQASVLHVWSPFAGSSQVSFVPNGSSIGYSGFQVGGIAFESAAVPEPPGLTLAAICLAVFSVAAFSGQRRRLKAAASVP